MSSSAITLREWENRTPAQCAELRGLVLEDPAVRQQARRLTDARKLLLHEMRDGLHVTALSHVGRLRLGPLTITVQPKIGPRDLLSLTHYAFGLREARWLEAAAYGSAGTLFQDLLIAQLAMEIRGLLDRGIRRAYVRRAEALGSPRGRIAFDQLARQGGLQRAELPCIHHSLSSDHPLNQLLAGGLDLALRMVVNRDIRKDVAIQQQRFSAVARPAQLDAATLASASRALDRLTSDYGPALTLLQALHAAAFVDLDVPPRGPALRGFLFDMNAFWQRLLQRFLSENLAPFAVAPEHRLAGLMRYVPGHNPKRRSDPTSRPDYAVLQGRRVVALLDAKYRDLWDKPLPADMLYQLALYALSHPGAPTSAILFPSTHAHARPSRIEIRNPVTGSGMAWVELRPVSISRLVETLNATGQGARAARAGFARSLAMGGPDAEKQPGRAAS
ncbi:MAG: hypothetical protein EA398_16945 [Deltaproteobacteria bacterium]|nr:MAG: hypothetical protein EA398_16945 [Deltaproteobacteria bacterium]